MNIGHKTTITALAIALGAGLSSVASAQNHDFKLSATLSFSSSSNRGTWNTVLIVSAVVFAVGLIQGDSTLALLGGAGALVSLVELNKNGYAPQYMPHGLDLVRRGPLSLGLNPFGEFGMMPGYMSIRPSFYAAMNFKF